MQKVYKTFLFTIASVLMFNSQLFAQDGPEESHGMHIIMENIERPPSGLGTPYGEHNGKLHAQLAELREATELAERDGRPEQAAEFNERANNLQRQIDEQAGQAERGRLHEAEIQLERLRNMTREAEEIVVNLRHNMARREMAMRRPEPVPMPERPFPERPGPERQWEKIMDMGHELREMLAAHLERTQDLIHRNRQQAEQMERKIHELSQENEMLRMQLSQRNEVNRDRERQIRQQMEELTQRQRQQLERNEREMRQRVEEQVRRDIEQRDRQRQERRERREQMERQREDLEIQSEPEVPIERPEEIETETEVEIEQN